MQASVNTYYENFEKLLALGANIHDEDAKQRTVLFHAAASGNASAVAKLIELGANVNKIAKRNKTALQVAVSKKVPSIVKLLLEAGAHIEPDDKGAVRDYLESMKEDPDLGKIATQALAKGK